MANEATLLARTSLPIKRTVADGTGIEKGSFLKLTDPNTAIIHSAANDPIIGIAAAEKIASDGVTTLAVYKDGEFKATLSGSCTVGDALVMDASVNHVKTAPNVKTVSGSNIVGRALETGATGETIRIELNPHTQRNDS